MSIVSKKTLEEWWNLIDLSFQHIDFLKKHVLEWENRFILPDGSSRPSFVRLSKDTLDTIDRSIITTILLKEENFRATYSREKNVGTFYWKYLIELPDSNEYLLDISSALGIIWIWDELQKVDSL